MDIAGAAKFRATRKEVMFVSVRERLLTIRVMEKMNANPAYAKAFGIVVRYGLAEPKRQPVSHSAADKS